MKSNQSRIADFIYLLLRFYFPLQRGPSGKVFHDAVPKEIKDAFVKTEPKSLRSAPIPSTRLSRAWHYTGLATSLGINAAKESFKVLTSEKQKSSLLNDQSTVKLVDTLTKMRGAALKLGQMLSIQEENPAFPKSVTNIMTAVQNSAYAMPQYQLFQVLASEFKNDKWKQDLFMEFQDDPIAAASIGQVHKARLKDSKLVAVKVQVVFLLIYNSIQEWHHLLIQTCLI